MRDINRLDKTYNTICELHKKYFPDLRTGQLFYNFFRWHLFTYKTDVFFLEEAELISRFKKYIQEVIPNVK